jgi:hypothetical protein
LCCKISGVVAMLKKKGNLMRSILSRHSVVVLLHDFFRVFFLVCVDVAVIYSTDVRN